MPILEQYPIADLLTWMDDKTLILNTNFQRRSVWQPAARAYLIDTILRGRSMPKVYIRTKTDPRTRRSYREVVDGQQRLKAIHDFANGQFSLGTKVEIYGDNAGKTYEALTDDQKREFLSYSVGIEQLFNASDEEVLDTFHRINIYGISLNPQELRHGKFQGDFRTAVVEASKRWNILWERYRVVDIRPRVRMADDEVMAQLLGILLEGIVDGGQPAINRMYKAYDSGFDPSAVERLDKTLELLTTKLTDALETPLAGSPHFLMLFAAVAHALFGIPSGQIPDKSTTMPARSGSELSDLDVTRANLGVLADVLGLSDIDDVPEQFKPFKFASAGSTQRIRSRRPRFLALFRAMQPQSILHQSQVNG